MKRCRHCEKGTLEIRRENYLYTDCGLPNVTLQDVEVRRCENCGATDVVLPHLAKLHRTIALAVVRKKGRLTGPEIRFLRKHIGFSGRDFAEFMGVDPATVSRWETGADKIGGPSERLLRVSVVAGTQLTEYADCFPDKGDRESDEPVDLRMVQRKSSDDWMPLSA